MAALLLAVNLFLSVHRLTRYVPHLSGILVGTAITGLGAVTGTSLNPAREFGPAVFAGQHGYLVSYLLAPVVGAALTAWLMSRLRLRVLTHHLSGRHHLPAAVGQAVA